MSADSRHKQMLAYVLADAFESAWTDHEEALRREGFRVAFTTAKAEKDIMRGFREIHRVGRGDSSDETDQKVQECIGIVALLIDRCDSDEALFKMYNYVKLKFPSKVGIDLYKYERNAFGSL